MARSFKKSPFMSICGDVSAKKDKQLAHRGERRAIQQALYRSRNDYDNFLLPHRLECAHNEVWGWNRDGKQSYCAPTASDWRYHLMALDPETHCRFEHMYEHYKKHYSEWPPTWYAEMMRK